MTMLYNMTPERSDFAEMLRKTGVLSAVLALGVTGIACRKGATATVDQAAVRPAGDAIAEADRDYAQRADLVKVRQGIVALRQAQADDSTNYELAWRLSEFNYYLGAHTPESSEQEKAFREGIEAGKRAVQLQPGKADGHFWLGANYGGNAQISTFAGLGEIDDIKREMEAVLKIDEGFQSGSAYLALGQVYLESPRLLGGDVTKAIGYLEKGVKLGPDNALLRSKLAEAYAEAHRDDDARKQIAALMAMKPEPDYKTEYDEAVAEAKKVQEKMK
jgi:TRAP transporter T-component